MTSTVNSQSEADIKTDLSRAQIEPLILYIYYSSIDRQTNVYRPTTSVDYASCYRAVTSTVNSQSEADIKTDLSRAQIGPLIMYIYYRPTDRRQTGRPTSTDQRHLSITVAVSSEIIAVVRYKQHGNYTPQRIDGTTEGREVEPLRWVVDGMYSSSTTHHGGVPHEHTTSESHPKPTKPARA